MVLPPSGSIHINAVTELLDLQHALCNRPSCEHYMIVQVEAFRRLYEQVGLGWVYAFTKNPIIGKVANAVYDVWARFRLPLTGRSDLLTIVENRRLEGKSCRIGDRPAQQSKESA
jgi:hypothetical protein